MKKAGANIIYALLIFLMTLPVIQLIFHPFNEKPLNGAFNLTEKPTFSLEKWNTGEFQSAAENYLKDHSGFRNFLVRLQNQVDFTFFRQANAEGAVIGRNKQLFEYDYIRSWLAIDYPGDSFIEKKLQRTKYVQEYLKQEKNIDLVVVFEPGKASFYPEFLPSKYTDQKQGPSTYDLYREKAIELDIDFIDFHQYFMQMKESSEYPLYPRYGTHWSIYGMHFASDSLLRLIEDRRNIKLPEARADSMVISNEPWDTDDDVLKTMNLLFQPIGEKLAYPVYSFDTTVRADKPMVLVVADSYYWNIFNTRIPQHLFANEAFWYFNTLVYPDHYLKPTYTADLNFKEEVEKQNVIFLMITERFLHKFDWRFIDQVYSLYTPEWLKDPVYDKINNIMQVAPWYEQMIMKAEKWNTTLENTLIKDGRYLLFKNDTAAFLVNYGPWHFMRIITDDPSWVAAIHEKAKQRGVSADTVLQEEALYIFRKDYPVMYELNRGFENMMKSIYSSPEILDSLKREISVYRFDLDALVRIRAWEQYKEEEIQKTCRLILNDPSWLEDVKKKALSRGMPLDEMIRLDAEYMWETRLKEF